MSKSFDCRKLNVAILTISDTRTVETDKGGDLIAQLLEQEYDVVMRQIVQDDKKQIVGVVDNWIHNPTVDVVITTGGTGIAQRDVTCEALQPLLEKEIVGFGELFRYLSFSEDIGTRAIASRALAGTYKNKLIFALPGSTGAVRLGIERIIKPELQHLFYELNK